NLAVTVGSSTEPLGNFTFSVTVAGNTNLVGAVSSSGSGASKVVSITPKQDAFGTNVALLNVNDGATTYTTNFTLQVQHLNQAPSLALKTNDVAVSGLSTPGGVITTPVTAVISDPDLTSPGNALAPAGDSITLDFSSTDSNIISPSSVFVDPPTPVTD